MKINPHANAPSAVAAHEREAVERAGAKPQAFSSELSKNIDDNYRERLTALLEKITKQGEQLSQNPTYSELRSYRNMVRGFIGEAVSRSYQMEARLGWDNRGRQKMYSIVRKVDEELAALAEDVRIGQDRQLSIMERLGAIRGLLVDMYV